MKTKPKTRTNKAADQYAQSDPPPPQTDGSGVTWVPLKQLKFHPLLEPVAMLDDVISFLRDNRKANPEVLQEKLAFRDAFKQSLKDDGIKTAILAVRQGHEWLVVNGRHRMTYGLAVGLEHGPVIEVTGETARQIILRENGLTWARTKSAIAWLAVSLHPEVVDISPGRPVNSDKMGINRSSLAAQIGVSSSLIDDACNLWREMRNSAEVRAMLEPRIAAGHSLSALYSGLRGKENLPSDDAGNLRRPPSSLTGVSKSLSTLKTQMKEFSGWAEEQKILAVIAARDAFMATNGGAEFLTRLIKASENL